MKTPASKITEHPFLRTMSHEHLTRIAEDGEELSFRPGEIIFREGDPANRFYLIETGRVALETKDPGHETVTVQILGSGEVMGWSWLFPPFVWHFQARALENTRMVALNGAHLLVLCNQDHEFGYELMKRLTQMVIARLQATRRRLLQISHQSAAGVR